MEPVLQSAELLRDRIREAFKDVPYPGDSGIVRHDHGDCALLRKDFAGSHWTSLQVSVLDRHAENLPCLTPEGFKFYLPAYLLAALEGPPPWGLDEAAIYRLVPPDTLDRELVIRFLDQVRGFNSSQIAVIRDFLHYMHDSEDCCCEWTAQKALELYWEPASQGKPPDVDGLTPPAGEGTDWIRMPNLISRTATEAVAELSALGLGKVCTIEEPQYPDKAVPEGTVLRTSPPPGEMARLKGELTIFVGGPIQNPPWPEQMRKENAEYEAAWADYRENPFLPNGEKKRPPPFL